MSDLFSRDNLSLLRSREPETLHVVSAVELEMNDVDEFGMPQKQPPRRRFFFLRNMLGFLKNRQHAVYKSLIHLPSIGITLAVLSLTFRRVFWQTPSSNTNVILNSLQFAAHLHGSLILMSLSAILLEFIHRGLSGQKGVPLGFLGSGFQLNSLSYMFCKEFRHLDFRYIGIFFGAFALAMLSNPSSAIVMIPRLQFWTLNKIWIGSGNVDFQVYIQANKSSLYPTTLTSDNAPLQCFQSNASLLSECPAYGMRRWLTIEEDLWNVGSNHINRTIEDGWIRYMVGDSSNLFRGSHSNYMAFTLSNFLGKALMFYSNLLQNLTPDNMGLLSGPTSIQSVDGVLARYDLSLRSAGKEIPTRKPWIEVECAGYPANATTLGLPHDMLLMPSSPDFSNAEWNFPASDFSNLFVDPNSTIINSSWVDIELFPSDQPRPSLGALFAMPSTSIYAFFTCAIDARWKYTSALLDASSGQAIVFEGGYAGSIPAALPSIYISDSWSTALNPPWINSITDSVPSNQNTLDTIGQMCFEKQLIWLSSFNASIPFLENTGSVPMLECLQVTLSVYLADAISRIQDSIPTYFVRSGQIINQYPFENSSLFDIFNVQDLYYEEGIVNIEAPQVNIEVPGVNDTYPGQITTISKADLEDSSRFTEMYMKPSRYGYGYGFEDSKLVFFGVSILLLHVALCLVYILWLLGIGKYSTTEWDSLGELLWVALKSSPISLESKHNGWWRERVIIEERKIDKFDDDNRTNRTVFTRALVKNRWKGSI